MKTVVLASASPRRSDILKQLRIPFRIEKSAFEEDGGQVAPADRPIRFAEGKALDVSERNPDELVLGFDTLVFLDGEPLGKPRNREAAIVMLKRLNGKTHKVISGVALARHGKLIASDQDETAVHFRLVSDRQIEEYVDSREPMDKAGAYAIQGLGASLVKSIDGCFYNVVGLPVAKTLELLEKVGD